jgi:hypothetical protein
MLVLAGFPDWVSNVSALDLHYDKVWKPAVASNGREWHVTALPTITTQCMSCAGQLYQSRK